MKSLILFTTICTATLGLQKSDPIVFTNVGVIRGLRDENGYSKFLGVPYGQVVNVFGGTAVRFLELKRDTSISMPVKEISKQNSVLISLTRVVYVAALPHPVFNDIFDAYDDTKVCAQSQTSVYGTTDCLNMNIYVPDSATTQNPLPVLVWIHGGGFVIGSSQQAADPLTLLRHEVIVVAINYRIGIYGFMCLDIPEVPGNTGLKDQLLALRWINENIEAFGGDVTQITLAGTSAGAMSTNLHLLSPHEKLFNRAIIQSGPANSYWMMVESNNTIPMRLAEELNFLTTDIYEALDFLSQVDPHVLVQTAHDLMILSVRGTDQSLTKPCVEKRFEGVENFMTEHPINIKSDKVRNIPVIIGYTNVEFASQLASIEPEFFESYDFRQHFELGFNMSNDLSDAIDVVKHFYIGDHDISEDDRWNIIDFGSDFIFNHAVQRMAEKLVEDGAETVFTYVFSHDGGLQGPFNKTWVGTTHGEDIRYIFGPSTYEGVSAGDLLIIDRYTALITNFVKYGDPTPQVTELLPVRWTPITETNYTYLDIQVDMDLKSRPFNDRMAFWDLFYTMYGRFQKWYESS